MTKIRKVSDKRVKAFIKALSNEWQMPDGTVSQKEANAVTENGRAILRYVARSLGYSEKEFKVWQFGKHLGPFSSVEVYLHTKDFYCVFFLRKDTFMYRRCEGLTDCVGGKNCWEDHQQFTDLQSFVDFFEGKYVRSS